MKNLQYHFPTCYAYSVKEPIGELNLKRVLDEDTRIVSSFFSLLSSSSPLDQTAVSGNSTPHQWSWESLSFSLSWSSVNPWHVLCNAISLIQTNSLFWTDLSEVVYKGVRITEEVLYTTIIDCLYTIYHILYTI